MHATLTPTATAIVVTATFPATIIVAVNCRNTEEEKINSLFRLNASDCLERLVSEMTFSCVERDVKLYSLTRSLFVIHFTVIMTVKTTVC